MHLERYYKLKLIRYAILTRLIILTLGFISNILIPDHDAHVFLAPIAPLSLNSTAFRLTNAILGSFNRWDAQYFQHIARHGYTYENSLAFFPLFPVLGRYVALSIEFIYPTHLDAAITVSLIGINFIVFIMATLALFDLTRVVFNDRFAFISGIVFCFNPATVFFVAPYTESLYSYLTFKAIYHSSLIRNGFNCTMAILFVTLSVLTRSNGLINIGFLIFFLIQHAVSTYVIFNRKKLWTFIKITMIYFCFCILVMAIPILFFLGLQYYHYYNFCTDFYHELPQYVVDYGLKHNHAMPGEYSKYYQPWCHYFIPLSYTYVQTKYWNMGFMHYYEWKQIPNFLLALPILSIMLKNIISYALLNYRYCYNGGFLKNTKDTQYKGIKCRNDIVFVCFVHAAFLTTFCIFFVHIQVSTRMICSANPAFYWICAYYFSTIKWNKSSLRSYWNHLTVQQIFLVTYLFLFISTGLIMFCNFLPWT